MDLQTKCKKLRLGSIYEIYPTIDYKDKEQYLSELFQVELDKRRDKKIGQMIKKARFFNPKTFDSYDWNLVKLPTTITKEDIMNLEFVKKKENLLLIGAVGTGKTHLATAIGIQACMYNFKVRFYQCADLVNLLLVRYKSGGLDKLMKELAKLDLLALDELGFVPFHRDGSELLFNIIASCYERNSVIVTSNLQFGEWNTVFGDNRLTSAIIDRLIHHAHIMTFTGESYRLRNALSANILKK